MKVSDDSHSPHNRAKGQRHWDDWHTQLTELGGLESSVPTTPAPPWKTLGSTSGWVLGGGCRLKPTTIQHPISAFFVVLSGYTNNSCHKWVIHMRLRRVKVPSSSNILKIPFCRTFTIDQYRKYTKILNTHTDAQNGWPRQLYMNFNKYSSPLGYSYKVWQALLGYKCPPLACYIKNVLYNFLY